MRGILQGFSIQGSLRVSWGSMATYIYIIIYTYACIYVCIYIYTYVYHMGCAHTYNLVDP